MKIRMKRIAACVLAASVICSQPVLLTSAVDLDENSTETTVTEESENIAENSEDSTVNAEETEQEEETEQTEEQTDGAEAVEQEESNAAAETAEQISEETSETDEQPEEEVSVITTYSLDASIFDDVSSDDWYCSYVTYVLNKGIMTGKGNNKFVGAEELSRGQFATVLYRMSGSPEASYSAIYPDVQEGWFYTTPVMWASASDVDVIRGYDDGTFGPSKNITREEMATMLYRYAKYKGLVETESEETESVLSSFPDASSVTAFAEEAMEWAVENKIITGDRGKLNPQGNTSRAVCATMIQRFCTTVLTEELPDVDISASSSGISVSDKQEDEGTFWVSVDGVTASTGISKVQVAVWCNSDQSDLAWYEASKQNGNSWGFRADVRNHSYHFGTYNIHAYVTLDNGIRLFVGSHQEQIDGTAAQVRLQAHVNAVYNEVGKDLNACYWWVVNNLSYRTLPIPLDPPDGYTSTEWYAIYGFEQKAGNCYCYAATFYWLAKGLGYDAKFVQGSVGMASGGYGPHGWVTITLNGATYICDPEMQDELSGYNFYMQPINSPVIRYRY